MTNDNDLIRRSDALKALDWGDIYGQNAQQAIRHIPAAPPADVAEVVRNLRSMDGTDRDQGGGFFGEAANLIETLSARLAAIEAERDAAIARAEKAEAREVEDALTEISGSAAPDHHCPHYQHCVDVARAARKGANA